MKQQDFNKACIADIIHTYQNSVTLKTFVLKYFQTFNKKTHAVSCRNNKPSRNYLPARVLEWDHRGYRRHLYNFQRWCNDLLETGKALTAFLQKTADTLLLHRRGLGSGNGFLQCNRGGNSTLEIGSRGAEAGGLASYVYNFYYTGCFR